MEPKLKITLPVMLHSESEIQAFLSAKTRLESLGESRGFPLEVGAFLPFMRQSSRTPENFAKQIENQAKHRLPIWLVEPGIQHTNSISYVPGDPTYDSEIPSELEATIIQTAKLRDLDPSAQPSLVVGPHIGIRVLPSLDPGNFSQPAVYSMADFIANRDTLYQRSKERFANLRELSRSQGLNLLLENSYSAIVEDREFWHGRASKEYDLSHQPFNDLGSLMDISPDGLVLDVAHFAAMKNMPAQYESNRDIVDPHALFSIMEISSWEEYPDKIKNLGQHLANARALHLSEVSGIGVRLVRGSEEERRWGGPNLMEPSEHRDILINAQARNLPVGIEEDYRLDPLTYDEADAFLSPVLLSTK